MINKYLSLIIGAILLTGITFASAYDVSTGGLYNYTFDDNRNAAGIELGVSQQVKTNSLGSTSVGLYQAYGVTADGNANSIGITSLSLRQGVNKLNVAGIKPFVESRLSLTYGQGQSPEWTASPTVGTTYNLKGFELFASVGYDFSLQGHSDGITPRLGINWKF